MLNYIIIYREFELGSLRFGECWLKIENNLVTNIMTFVNMQLCREMFDLATQFARNKEICLEQILFYSFVAVNVSFSQQQKINK